MIIIMINIFLVSWNKENNVFETQHWFEDEKENKE